MSTPEVGSVAVMYSPSEGKPWQPWPQHLDVPTISTLKFLHTECKHASKKNQGVTCFCGIWFHAMKIGKLEWDCINGFRSIKVVPAAPAKEKSNVSA